MDAPTPLAEMHAADLAELRAMGMELARETQSRAMAAGTAAGHAELASVFHRLARGVRMTIALEAKLAAEAAKAALREAARPGERRRALARARIGRAILGHAEDREHREALSEALDFRLEEERLFDELPDLPVEVLIERIRDDLGLPPGEPPPPCSPAPPEPVRWVIERPIVEPPPYDPAKDPVLARLRDTS